MIGVIADATEQNAVREFFELFKTPWEFYCRGRQYEVLLHAGDGHFEETAQLVILYAGRKTRSDDEHHVHAIREGKRACVLAHQGSRIPIYGDAITFPEIEIGVLTDEDSQQCVGYISRSKDRIQARIGYDLFGEVRTLLSVGQPAANAAIPALELHIAFLRDLITGCGISVIEVPPVPDGYRFIACLTHDVDHPSIRQHKWDHTTLGFLYRAVFGSLRDLIRTRISVKVLLANWAAALKLPFVYLGLAKDFWQEFDDRYLEFEKGVPSTFFVIPFRNRPGKTSNGKAPKFRAARYGAKDIASTIQKLVAAGCEVGLHGIDAWLDESGGHEELEEIRRLTGVPEVGVRMHWLYYDRQSPQALEKAGAVYDSTIGYNQTVGYRAGTTQVFKPIEATSLLELPLHAMDTALFYPAHLALSSEEATTLLGRIADSAVQFGGCITVNWHDRSVAPERQWDGCYCGLVQELKSRGAWFATAGQAVSWFRKRRAVAFETDSDRPDALRARIVGDHGADLPGLRMRTYKGRESGENGAHPSEEKFDMVFSQNVDLSLSAPPVVDCLG